MMRKKQIFRMLVGALTVCMATACSNETDVLNGFPTDGNTLSINLRTNDIGATTRATIATEAESEVKSLSAYLFSKGESNEYKLEKIYNNLTWDNEATTHTVALTGIEERGPKKVYFVANGTGISTLTSASANLPEADFQALLMNKMGNNPATPLAMTAQAELADWSEGVNNAVIQDAAMLKRVSARVDLVVAPQEGLSFEPTSIALAAATNSYIFPNEEAYNGSKETIEISGGTTLYPYETAAGTVKEVKVTGTVKVGETEKEATFVVPFVDKEGKEIAIERNHRYTVNIARINGFYSIEASITVSDWNAAGFSGDLEAGEELKMTATEYENGQLATAPAATAVYPTDETKTAVVELESTDAKVYKIYVGSANIEAEISWGDALPDGWTMTEPADTRAEYLWEKSYWTLTIPANESQDAKSLTVKAVNKLEQAKDQNTKKYVEITFTQKGKQGEDTKNPGDMDNWGGGDDPQEPTYSESSSIIGKTQDGWCKNGHWLYPDQYFGKVVTYTNGIKNTVNTLSYEDNNIFTEYKGTSSILCSNSSVLDAIYYQWGRSMGFPSTVETIVVDPAWGYQNYFFLSSGNVMSKNWLNGVSNHSGKYGYNNTSYSDCIWDAFYAAVPNTTDYPINTVAKINDFGIIYFKGKSSGNRDYYTGNEELTTLEARGGDPCPAGYRMPTAEELQVLIPSTGKFTNSYSEIKEVNGSYYAMQWIVTSYSKQELPYVTIKSVKVSANTNLASVDFSKASSVNLGTLGYIDNSGIFTIQADGYYMGLYWSSDYISSTGRIKYLEIDIKDDYVEMGIFDNASPSWGACVLPIKDETATGKGSIITPLLPLFNY